MSFSPVAEPVLYFAVRSLITQWKQDSHYSQQISSISFLSNNESCLLLTSVFCNVLCLNVIFQKVLHIFQVIAVTFAPAVAFLASGSWCSSLNVKSSLWRISYILASVCLSFKVQTVTVISSCNFNVHKYVQ